MSVKNSPYETLGVTPKATQDEIRNAYRALAKKLHPDLNPGNKHAESKFKEINAAYELVGTAEERAKFERGEAEAASVKQENARQERGPFYHQTQQGGGRYSQSFEGMDDDLLRSMFGRMGGQDGPRFRNSEGVPGQDVLYQMEVEFKDAILGAEREVTLTEGKRLHVKIPSGITSGSKLRFPGYGLPGSGKAPAGDAYVELTIKPSPLFNRLGNDLEIELPISISEALLGSEVKVPTLDGSVLLKVPAGVSSGARLRVKGKGVPSAGSVRGDQFVVLKIITPSSMDAEFKSAVESWSKRQAADPRADWIGAKGSV